MRLHDLQQQQCGGHRTLSAASFSSGQRRTDRSAAAPASRCPRRVANPPHSLPASLKSTFVSSGIVGARHTAAAVAAAAAPGPGPHQHVRRSSLNSLNSSSLNSSSSTSTSTRCMNSDTVMGSIGSGDASTGGRARRQQEDGSGHQGGGGAHASTSPTPPPAPAAGAGAAVRLPRCSTVSLQTELAAPSLLVFSGGTAFNSVAGHLRKLTTHVSHVLPVSDDGGSTAEIVRVIGGPAVGDIRSRCLRLADDAGEEARAVRRLLAHRLPGSSSREAKLEWYSIVEGNHPLWAGVSEPYKHMIRAFLVEFQSRILSQVQHEFSFVNGSIGNFFFAGARGYFGSLESAIFLFSKVARFPEGSTVMPAICTEEVITLGAELEDGTVIRGQNNISHPSSRSSSVGGDSDGGGPSAVDKSTGYDPLPSPVRRVFYLSREGTGQEHEVSPGPNPAVLQAAQGADAVCYGMGSLYTSICPALILEGVGEAIAARQDIPKLLLLNGSHDRETASCGSTHGDPMRASDVVTAITDALNRRRSRPTAEDTAAGKQRRPPLKHPPPAYISTILTPQGGAIEIDRSALQLLGVTQVIEVPSSQDPEGRAVYDPDELVAAIGQVLLAHSSQQHQHSSNPALTTSL